VNRATDTEAVEANDVVQQTAEEHTDAVKSCKAVVEHTAEELDVEATVMQSIMKTFFLKIWTF
jgi:hypothetical protein